MQELEQAEYEVEVYENHIEVIQSIHKECSDPIDWESIAISKEPQKPENLKNHEKAAKSDAENYSPSFIDRLFKREEKNEKGLMRVYQVLS